VYALGVADLLFAVIDVASGWPHAGVVVAARGLLASVLLGSAAALGRARGARVARLVVVAGGVSAAACLAVVAWGAGGARGPYLPFLPLLPIVLFIAAPDVPLAIGLCGAVAAVPGLSMLLADSAPAASLALWSAAFASGTGYGLVGAILHVRVRRREAAVLAELARSETRRERAERLALAGRLAGGVAHGVNSPLAAVLANVRFAEEALARGRAGADANSDADADAREALADARAGLERIRRLMLDLGALSRNASGDRAAFHVHALVAEARRIAEVRGVRIEALDLAAGLPAVRVPRAAMAQVLAGVLVSAAEAGREHGEPVPLRIAARQLLDHLVVEVVPLAAEPRPDPRALEADPLVLLAREHLEGSGGALEVFAGEGGAGMRLFLPIGADAAPVPASTA
jgi:signal transduction histidine kinase